LQYKTLKKLT